LKPASHSGCGGFALNHSGVEQKSRTLPSSKPSAVSASSPLLLISHPPRAVHATRMRMGRAPTGVSAAASGAWPPPRPSSLAHSLALFLSRALSGRRVLRMPILLGSRAKSIQLIQRRASARGGGAATASGRPHPPNSERAQIGAHFVGALINFST